jgi:hypothetical protein
VEDDNNIPKEDLKDTGTSLVLLAKAMATKERHVVGYDVVAINTTSPLHK